MSNNLNQALHSPGEIIRDSPLDVLREGNLELAWSIADLFEIERCVMWYLLLAWELKDKGRLTEGRATLERLQEKELPRLRRSWLGMLEPHLLAYVFDLSEEAFTALHQKLVHSQHIALCRYLAIEEHFTTALEMAELIDHGESRSLVLREIAVAQAQAGDIVSALATVHLIKEQSEQGQALREIAVAQAQAGDTTPIQTARLIEDERQQEGAIVEIVEIAKAQTKPGDKIAARSTFTTALEMARGISDNGARNLLLLEIAAAMAQAGDIASAMETVQRFDDHRLLPWTLVEIAIEVAQTGEFVKAVRIAGLIYPVGNHVGEWRLGEWMIALQAIAQAQVKAGNAYAARSTLSNALQMAQPLDNEAVRAWTLVEILSIPSCNPRQMID